MVSYRFPVPKTPDDFEDMVCALYREELNDKEIKRFGRRGQAQNGVDIYSPQNRRGIQCKNKGLGEELTEAECLKEIGKAETFTPELKHYIIATTAKKDAEIQKVILNLSETRKQSGKFTVEVVSWEDLGELFNAYPEVMGRYYPGRHLEYKAMQKDIQDVRKNQEVYHEEVKEQNEELKAKVEIMNGGLAHLISDCITKERHLEIDESKELLAAFKPCTAFDLLERLKKRIWEEAPKRIKFRILTNMASAKLQLSDEKTAVELFLEALKYDEEDEKALTNAAIANILLEEYEEADKILQKVIDKNPINGIAYSLRVEILSSQGVKYKDIIEKIPEKLNEDKDVTYSVAVAASREKEYQDAAIWARKSLNVEANPRVQEFLGSMRLENEEKNPEFGGMGVKGSNLHFTL